MAIDFSNNFTVKVSSAGEQTVVENMLLEYFPNRRRASYFSPYLGYLAGEGSSYIVHPRSSHDRSAFGEELYQFDEFVHKTSITTSINNIKQPKIMSKVINFVKDQALKLNNPNEYELRKAGLHDSCGELTQEGKELRDSFLEELVADKMLATAQAINADTDKE